MPERVPPPRFDLASIEELVRQADDSSFPPVHLWNPPHCGASGIRVARDGTWYHDDTPIRRSEMIRLFSQILRREADGGFVLVTPVEKLDIEVEDTPFVAVEVRSEGDGRDRLLAFRLNTGQVVVAGRDHTPVVKQGRSGPRPLLAVRPGLIARSSHPAFFTLAELALGESPDNPGLWSDGCFFSLDAEECG